MSMPRALQNVFRQGELLLVRAQFDMSTCLCPLPHESESSPYEEFAAILSDIEAHLNDPAAARRRIAVARLRFSALT